MLTQSDTAKTYHYACCIRGWPLMIWGTEEIKKSEAILLENVPIDHTKNMIHLENCWHQPFFERLPRGKKCYTPCLSDFCRPVKWLLDCRTVDHLCVVALCLLLYVYTLEVPGNPFRNFLQAPQLSNSYSRLVCMPIFQKYFHVKYHRKTLQNIFI